MRYSEIISESDIVDLTKARDERRLQTFHTGLKDDLSTRAQQRAEHVNIAKEAGEFEGFVVGERIRTPKGFTYKIMGYNLTPVKSMAIKMRREEFFQKMGWGEPRFVSIEGSLYEPMIHVQNDDEDTYLNIAALRQTGFTPLRGPQR